MRQGTISVLLGCHSPIHSYYVWKAWRVLYGRSPFWKETVCILLHDIGHWGKDYLTDYEQKRQHWVLGAKVARFLFGQWGYDMVAGHCTYSGVARSPLYKADKYSWILSPYWWLMTHRTFEPKLARKGMSHEEDVRLFMAEVRQSVKDGRWVDTHEFFLKYNR